MEHETQNSRRPRALSIHRGPSTRAARTIAIEGVSAGGVIDVNLGAWSRSQQLHQLPELLVPPVVVLPTVVVVEEAGLA